MVFLSTKQELIFFLHIYQNHMDTAGCGKVKFTGVLPSVGVICQIYPSTISISVWIGFISELKISVLTTSLHQV